MSSPVSSRCAAAVLAAFLAPAVVQAQPTTLPLPKRTLVGLANVVSGARPLANLIEIAGYNRDRDEQEFAGTYFESDYIARKAREYGFSDVQILRYEGRPIWDGVRGELWVVDPVERKIVDFRDIPTALAPGSASGTYEGEMVWVENAHRAESYEGLDVEGKIVLTEASTAGAYRQARRHGALGVVNANSPRKFAAPEAILWSSVARGPARDGEERGFAFNISAPMLQDLRRLVRQHGSLTLRAEVESAWREADNEVITAVIPGDGSTDEWVYYSAHVFEGVNKQGAADDGSGAVAILEAGRAMLEAIERGFVSRPARNIRFIWVDEFSGTYAFLDDHQEELSRTVADINIDMIGQAHNRGNNADRLYRMPDSRIHYLADAAEAFFDWMAQTNIEHVHTRNVAYDFSYPILDPYGTRDAFRYVVEPFYGSSDHQVYNDRGVPAVLFNHWPDMVYHTSHDRTDRMDATALKRACFIAAATGLVVAGAREVEPLAMAGEALTRGRSRIASDMRRWMTLATTIEPTGEALGAFARDFLAAVDAFRAREARNVRSVLELTRGSTSDDPASDRERIEALAGLVEQGAETDRQTARRFMEGLAQAHGVKIEATERDEALQRAARMVPRWKGERPSFVRVPARGLRGFSSMEVRNFIDGRRSALAIRDAVNAEYAPTYGLIDLDAVVAYLEALEKAELIEIERR